MRKKIIYPSVTFIGVFIFHVLYSIWTGSRSSRQWMQVEEINFLSLYFVRQDYFLGVAYALAGAFTIYAGLKCLESYKTSVTGVLGGVTLSALLYFGGCLLLGCCGSPLLTVYLSLFGSSFLGFTKPIVLTLTLTSVVIGYFWIEKKTKKSIRCCIGKEKRQEVNSTSSKKLMDKIQSELQEGMSLAKCRKCGCMKEGLETLRVSLSLSQTEGSADLLKNIGYWLNQMEPIKYTCLGCEYCFPAVGMNTFTQAFPEVSQSQALSCNFEFRNETWPPVPGEYFSFCDGPSCPVAVSTLASVELAENLARIRPKELCIVGKTETENIGIEKVIKNTITNPTIRFLLLAGKDAKGHQSGRTLYALWENGVDASMRVVGSTGSRPVLRNVTRNEVDAFRRQVKMVDIIGVEDTDKIIETIKYLSREPSKTYCGDERAEETQRAQISTGPVIQAKEPAKVELDKTGYFVIIPQPDKGIITAEHYSYENKLLRVIEGKEARSIYGTIIDNGWITLLSHAAYLGKELAKAELAIKFGFKYIQDGTGAKETVCLGETEKEICVPHSKLSASL
ncbi:MAG: hypothetical protein QME64_01155 [bacterium]|nr:hypothetical protein [bacterium]